MRYICAVVLFVLFTFSLAFPFNEDERHQTILKELLKSKDNVLRFQQSKSNTEESKRAETCGYASCNTGQKGMVNVHLVPHTHDDVGWLKTVDQYFYGAQTNIQKAGVQYILDSVIAELLTDPKKRFIYVEIAFFARWWREQHDFVRHQVGNLVDEGRLEFILGGWCMNDEAATHYVDIIDQHTLGFRFLNRSFGECARPRIGWQIDPFGHSREQASLFAQFGFDGLFFGRLDYQDKDKRLKDKTMEHIWMASASLGDAASLFTGVNYDGYGPPGGFCFDEGCDDQPIMDDERLHDFNANARADAFIKASNDQAAHYTTNHIMMTFGSDFQFQNAHQNYKNIDKLIKYVNAKSGTSKVNVFYSTPSCYLYAMNKENMTYTQKMDDFFPYASRENTFWTGYFTSRPALKGYVRLTSATLQAVRQLDVISGLFDEGSSYYKIDRFEEAQGVAQHHDAVSGTEKQAVAYDYAMRLAEGMVEGQEVINDALKKLLTKNAQTPLPDQMFCNLVNVSNCHITEGADMFTVIVYNPLAKTRKHYVHVPVAGTAYTVSDGMSTIKSQMVPVSVETKAVPEYKGSMASSDLVFLATIPPLGVSTYFVQKSKDLLPPTTQILDQENMPNADMEMKNEYLSLTYDGATGMVKKLTDLMSKKSIMFSQSLMYYNSFAGDNSQGKFQASGAYCFRPNGTDAMAIAAKPEEYKYVMGDQVQELRTRISSWAYQVIRLYAGARHLEWEYTVGPIPFKDGMGKEVISRFTTDLDTKGRYYTDANGREVLERIRDYRPTWNLNQTEAIAGNYYPVNALAFIKDKAKDLQLTVVTDRSQGGASIKDGQLELMVHRRTLHDDSFGVGEPLNETGIGGDGLVVRGRHFVILSPASSSASLYRDVAEKAFSEPLTTFAMMTGTTAQYTTKYRTTYSAVKTVLPANVRLLTLAPWNAAETLIRLEHIYEKSEDPVLSKPAMVSLKDLFSDIKISKVEELTLGANQLLSDARRLSWKVSGRMTNGNMSSFVDPMGSDMKISLKPMQIRTFRVSMM